MSWNKEKGFTVDEKSKLIFKGHEYDKRHIDNRCEDIKNSILGVMGKSELLTIGIYMHRTPDLIFSMMFCLNYGNTYVLLDEELPSKRLLYIIEDSSIDIIISDLDIDLELRQQLQIPIVCLLNNKKSIYREQKLKGPNHALAYIAYTSGTTGVPKGVEITRESLINFVDGMKQYFWFSSGESMACLTACMFDIFFVESVMPLLIGMTVYLADKSDSANPRKLSRFLIDNRIDNIQMTPSRMMMLLNDKKREVTFQGVKRIMIGGEAFSSNLAKMIHSVTDSEIYNLYGPTEATIWATINKVEASEEFISVGLPMLNTDVFIIDGDREVENDVKGEIYISGDGLAKGYHNKPEETQNRFREIEIGGTVRRCYATGDIGKKTNDGNIYCYGRTDNQIKIRGYRIEPEEIEKKIVQIPKVMQAIVFHNEKLYIDMLVCLYVSGNKISDETFKSHLKVYLPEYMIPTRYIRCDNFPQNQNGKIDRKHAIEISESEAWI
ncbi:MAG: amino acid adenylation domain-containing protein [Pseudobutyrivibrio sp.]|nr:amino acid adenylation domain-containing protein [Clostridia bacterium]MCF0132098.1 amino acid adenylation domain-containing protein [Pseudobutyrivibrio sp.]